MAAWHSKKPRTPKPPVEDSSTVSWGIIFGFVMVTLWLFFFYALESSMGTGVAKPSSVLIFAVAASLACYAIAIGLLWLLGFWISLAFLAVFVAYLVLVEVSHGYDDFSTVVLMGLLPIVLALISAQLIWGRSGVPVLEKLIKNRLLRYGLAALIAVGIGILMKLIVRG